jgi:hypothetical protein
MALETRQRIAAIAGTTPSLRYRKRMGSHFWSIWRPDHIGRLAYSESKGVVSRQIRARAVASKGPS